MDIDKIALYTEKDQFPSHTGPEAIRDMFAHTGGDGTLYIPAWPRGGSLTGSGLYKCSMTWNAADAEKTVSDFEVLREDLRLTSVFPEDDPCPLALPEELRPVWDTFVTAFDTGDMDLEKIEDISDRLDTIAEIEGIREKMEAGEEISDLDRDFFNDWKDVAVSEDERALYAEYGDRIRRDAERRVGEGPAAYDLVIRAKRLRRLYSLEAPEFVIRREASLLAQAMAVHGFASSVEEVADTE